MTDDELPEGCALATVPELFVLNPPKPRADEFADDLPVSVPMPAVEAETGTISAPKQRAFAEVRKGFTAFRDGDVILAKITQCMENGKAAIARNLTNGLGFGSTEFHVFRSTGAALPEYLFHFIRQESFRRNAEAEMSGSVGRKRVPAEFLKGVELPLPPLAEHRRIVAAVERIHDQVTAGRARGFPGTPRHHDREGRRGRGLQSRATAAACQGQSLRSPPRSHRRLQSGFLVGNGTVRGATSHRKGDACGTDHGRDFEVPGLSTVSVQCVCSGIAKRKPEVVGSLNRGSTTAAVRSPSARKSVPSSQTL
mgnify:CR=1 FL=1